MDSLMTETRVDKRKLDEAQQQRLDDAAREMNESFRAYGQMRDLVVDPEWKPAGPPSPDAPTMLEEISTLEQDIRSIAIKTVRVYAEASWSLGSVGPFRIRLQSDANDILRWIFALVNKKMSKEDIPLLPWDAIEQAVHQEVANQIRRAEREWDVSPPWRTLDPELAALPGSGSATNVPEKPGKPASPLVRVASSEGIAPSATEPQAIEERAARRQAVVNPILHQKRWKRGRLATAAGVGKNSVYEYLDGTRAKITDENRNAIAQALDLKPKDLPD
jgi:DNA-binding Xre family transcriptional regulator